MKTIQLTQGKEAQVSDEDYVWLSQWKWSAQKQTRKNRTTWYAYRSQYLGGGRAAKKERLTRMHREIALRSGLPFSNVYDHVDGNTLNNQRENIRPATHSQNNQNRGKSPGCTSEFKGVSWIKTHHRWRAKLNIDHRAIHLGFFEQEQDAAKSYNVAAQKHFGKFALLNPV